MRGVRITSRPSSRPSASRNGPRLIPSCRASWASDSFCPGWNSPDVIAWTNLPTLLRRATRAIDEYLAVLDDAAFGAATEVTPKFVSPADPAPRWTGAHGGQAFFAYSTNYLIDVEHAVFVDVEA
jgi:hypothetical protein